MKVFLLFYILIIFIACEKKTDLNNYINIIEKRTDSYLIINDNIEENNKNNINNFIKNYYYTEKYDQELYFGKKDVVRELDFLFKEEGNFTNSGHKEVLAFYQFKERDWNDDTIWPVYCFIYNDEKQEMIDVIFISYSTGYFKDYLEKMPMNELGREIKYKNNRFGFIGDFNENEKEELYLYEETYQTFPAFFEFNEGEFRRIIDVRMYSYYADIINIDKENKIIHFEGLNDNNEKIYSSYAWNSYENLYKRRE